jgi:hypothetical protein
MDSFATAKELFHQFDHGNMQSYKKRRVNLKEITTAFPQSFYYKRKNFGNGLFRDRSAFSVQAKRDGAFPMRNREKAS